MKIQIYNDNLNTTVVVDEFLKTSHKLEGNPEGFLKNSLILVFTEISTDILLKISVNNKILIVNNNNYYKKLKLNNVYYLNSTNEYLCFNGTVILSSCIINDNFINQINKWIDYKLIIITCEFIQAIEDLNYENKKFLYIHKNSNKLINYN